MAMNGWKEPGQGDATDEQAAAMDADVDAEYADLDQERRILDVTGGMAVDSAVDGCNAKWTTHEAGEWIDYEGAVIPIRQ